MSELLLCDPPDVERLCEMIALEFELDEPDATSAIRQVAAAANARLFPALDHLELIHTEGCNLACSYCCEKEMLGYRRMSHEVARKGIDLFLQYARDVEHLSILHFGGEPTVNFAAVRTATEYAEQRAAESGKTVEFHMTSNGILFNEVMVDYFAEHEIMVLLSMDGLKESHDRYRRDRLGRGTFERALNSLRLLKSRQPWIGIKMTVMPQNVERLFSDVRALYGFGVNQFLIGHATGVPWSEDRIQEYGSQMAQLRAWFLAEQRSDLRIEAFENEDSGRSYFGCRAGRNSITVSVDGQVSPCAKILGLGSKQILAKLGDVEHGLTHLRTRLELNHTHKLRRQCEDEGVAREYRGGCFASNFSARRDLFKPALEDHKIDLLLRGICAGCGGH